MKIFFKGFNYSQDGPGNRLVYHMQGCNFRCPWCSNPESMECIQENANDISIEYLLEEIKRSKAMFFDGGGVTFTGGEPTIQFDELKELLILLKKEDVHTAIETNGSSKKLRELMGYIDFPIMDIKHYDTVLHKKIVGIDNQTTLDNFEKVTSLGKNLLVRIPVINGFNNHPEGFAEYFSKYNTQNICFEILPYHEYGKEKWTKPYKVENGFISKEDYNKFIDVFKEYGLKTVKM